MTSVPSRVADRLRAELKKLKPALLSAKERDINESDTGLIVAAILSDVLGFNRFLEITSEYAIRGTYCDLALKIDGKLKLLVEVKAIGLDLKDNHLKQAVDYAANQGVDWVALTNGAVWRVYRVVFGKPIDSELVFEANLLEADTRNAAFIERMYLLSREGLAKMAISAYHEEKQATSRFMIAAVLQSDAVLDIVRREVRRISNGVRIDASELREMLRADLLKRDVVEGEQATTALARVKRKSGRAVRRAATAPAPAGPDVDSAASSGGG